MKRYKVKIKKDDIYKNMTVSAKNIMDAEKQALDKHPNGKVVGVDELVSDKGGAIIYLFMCLLVFYPTFTMIKNYIKPSGNSSYYKIWRFRWFLLALLYDVLLIFWFVNLFVLKVEILYELLTVPLSFGTIAYAVGYIVWSYKQKDFLCTNNTSQNKLYFGTYYINFDKQEPIEWDILEEKDGKILIITHNIIDVKPFDTKYQNYEKSSIRNWLNNDFYNSAFDETEKKRIQLTLVDNSLDSTGDSYNQYICSDTSDNIFLLSVKEAKTYYKTDEERQAKGSRYAIKHGLSVFKEYSSITPGSWWLRSPAGRDFDKVFEVDLHGFIFDSGLKSAKCIGVRPVCWITLED